MTKLVLKWGRVQVTHECADSHAFSNNEEHEIDCMIVIDEYISIYYGEYEE